MVTSNNQPTSWVDIVQSAFSKVRKQEAEICNLFIPSNSHLVQQIEKARAAQYLVAVEEIARLTTSQNLRTESLLPGEGTVTGHFCAQFPIFLNLR